MYLEISKFGTKFEWKSITTFILEIVYSFGPTIRVHFCMKFYGAHIIIEESKMKKI